mmetsp:Transcript_7994/g.18808  ORF Transcript_7994/g.18808 Transcript_7994/m.18808 type:complete len:241 (+) Transcript_7994:1190-1912(+)
MSATRRSRSGWHLRNGISRQNRSAGPRVRSPRASRGCCRWLVAHGACSALGATLRAGAGALRPQCHQAALALELLWKLRLKARPHCRLRRWRGQSATCRALAFGVLNRFQLPMCTPSPRQWLPRRLLRISSLTWTRWWRSSGELSRSAFEVGSPGSRCKHASQASGSIRRRLCASGVSGRPTRPVPRSTRACVCGGLTSQSSLARTFCDFLRGVQALLRSRLRPGSSGSTSLTTQHGARR